MNYENIKKLRKARGWTQTELGEKIGVSKNSISAWEQGKSEPKGESLSKLADLFGCTTDYLCGVEIPEKVKLSTDNDRVFLIEQIMEEDALTIHRLLRYYELLKKNEES